MGDAPHSSPSRRDQWPMQLPALEFDLNFVGGDHSWTSEVVFKVSEFIDSEEINVPGFHPQRKNSEGVSWEPGRQTASRPSEALLSFARGVPAVGPMEEFSVD